MLTYVQIIASHVYHIWMPLTVRNSVPCLGATFRTPLRWAQTKEATKPERWVPTLKTVCNTARCWNQNLQKVFFYCIDSWFYLFVGIVTLFYFYKGLLIGVLWDFLGFTDENWVWIFWDKTQCYMLICCRCFGQACSLHLQGSRKRPRCWKNWLRDSCIETERVKWYRRRLQL